MIDVLDPERLEGLPNTKVLRQSMLGSIDVCHRRVLYDLDPNIPWGSGAHRIFGTAYHAGVEAHYLGAEIEPAVQAVFDSEEAGLVTDWGDDWIDADQAHAHALQLVSKYLPHAWDNIEGVEVIGTETMVYATIGHTDWIMRGQLDLVLDVSQSQIGEGHEIDHLIVDHKTARRKWKKGKEHARNTNQPSWYTTWWPVQWAKAHDGEYPRTGFVFDVMAQDGTFERRWPDVTNAHQVAVLRKASLAMDLIDNDGPWLPNTQSFLCSEKWCDHWERCPFGAALDD